MITTRKSDGAELPDGWRMVRLGDIAEVRKGQSFTSSDLVVGGVPVIAGGTSPAYYHAHSNREAHTITISASGANAGFVAFHDSPILATDCNTISASETAESITFIYQVLKYRQRSLFDRRSGSAQPHVYPQDVRSLPILLPPLFEQHAVASVLDSIDEAIERTEAVIAAYETLRDSLLHELLTRGVPGWHAEWKDVPGIGTIPADWVVVQLGEVIETSTYGTNEPLGDNGNIVVLRMNNIRRGEIDWSEVKRAELSERELNELGLRPGDILFNRTNSLDLVGKIAMVRDLPEPTSFASYLVRMRTKVKIASPVWLSTLLGSTGYQSRIRRFATPGVSQANINPTNLKSLTIPLPSISEQAIVVAVLDGIREQVQHARHEHETLQQAKTAIANELLSGQMRARNMAN